MPIDVAELLDPSFRTFVSERPFTTVSADTLPLMRARFVEEELSDAVERVDHVVPGDPPVPVRVHRAKDAGEGLAGVLSIHGGGYVAGSHASDDAKFDRWCRRHPLVGVSVEYRLAPEWPYPDPLEDCYRALRWTAEHASELGIDPSAIGVAGVSAGGGLAAALALVARDRGEVALAFQLLDCPMLDDRQRTRSSQLDGLPVWNRESNAFGWRSYLGARYGGDDVPPYAAPARADDLSALPPALVSVGSVDGFLDEDVEYALRLIAAGVPTELHVYPGAPHGFRLVPDAVITRRAERDLEEWLAARIEEALG